MTTTTDVQVGTRVLANDKFSQRLGEVSRIDYTPWGKHFVIAVDGGGITEASLKATRDTKEKQTRLF